MQQSGICNFVGLIMLPLILGPGIARGAAGPTTAARFFKFCAYAYSSKRVTKKVKEKPHLKAFALACHSRPISTLILTLL